MLERVRRRLVDSAAGAEADHIAEAVREETGGVVGDAQLLAILRTLRGELVGAGPLDGLLRMPHVTDVLVTAPDEVWIDRGDGPEAVAVTFRDDGEVRRLAVRLASACGRRLDDAQPFVDGHLPGGAGDAGVRVHAMLSPPAEANTLISLRVLRRSAMALDDLVSSGSVAGEAAELVRGIIAARRAFAVTGGTGTGKTTLLSALLAEVPSTERILCVEDTPELQPRHPHVVKLVAKPPNIEGAGEITQRDLLRQALRMRPDRIVVGEIRGAEVVDLLAALNTGHDGGAGTVHANTAADVPARFEALGALGGLDRSALHAQLAPALRVILAVERVEGRRRLAQIGVLDGNPVRVRTAWHHRDGRGEAIGALRGLTGAEASR
ncbi:TadA family conjugal transfer-associated ATPase [uncultured Corynebacterium sp.]|uniref:TadA family conjugal transfer-associated ATPase n=1 Tax=uncultured Corynebacterium sp. TaxID=159447 RepID=UPI0025F1878F|nr:TadA family conjugal transfer-associated ATPase [uncultured Corynebacterium sp.]